MPRVKDLDALHQMRADLQKQHTTDTQIFVAMGSAAIASGAKAVLAAINDFIQQKKIANIEVIKTGDFGMDNYEPVVQVQIKDSALTTYGPVDTKAIARILEEHVVGGNIVEEYLIGK